MEDLSVAHGSLFFVNLRIGSVSMSFQEADVYMSRPVEERTNQELTSDDNDNSVVHARLGVHGRHDVLYLLEGQGLDWLSVLSWRKRI